MEGMVAPAHPMGARQSICRAQIFGAVFKLKRKRIIFDLFYFFFTYFLFFFGVIMSNAIFVVNLFYDLHLSVGFLAMILWILAFSYL